VLTPAQNRHILDIKLDARSIVLGLSRRLLLAGSTHACMQAMPSDGLCMVCRPFTPTYMPQITTVGAVAARALTIQFRLEDSFMTSEADLGMFNMFGRTGAPQKRAPQKYRRIFAT